VKLQKAQKPPLVLPPVMILIDVELIHADLVESTKFEFPARLIV